MKMENMKANGNFEMILSNYEDGGILVTIYKKFPTDKLMVIDYSIAQMNSFSKLKEYLNDIEEIEIGYLLYSGTKNIQELKFVFVDLGFKVGINNTPPREKTTEEKISILESKMKQAAENEDFVLAASYRDQIKSLKS